MAWLTIESEVPGSWRFKKLKNAMGWDDKTTLGALALLWMYSQQQDYSHATKSMIINWLDASNEADAEKQFNALLTFQWIAKTDEEGVFEIKGNEKHLVHKRLKQAAASKAGKASALSKKTKRLQRDVGSLPLNSIQEPLFNSLQEPQVNSQTELIVDTSDAEVSEPGINGVGKESKSGPLWQAYVEEYVAIHHEEPAPRNAKVNSQLCNLVGWFGREKAIEVVRHYFKLPNVYYHRNFHPVGILVKDAHAIYGSLRTGKFITNTQARQMDSTAATASQIERIKRGEV